MRVLGSPTSAKSASLLRDSNSCRASCAVERVCAHAPSPAPLRWMLAKMMNLRICDKRSGSIFLNVRAQSDVDTDRDCA